MYGRLHVVYRRFSIYDVGDVRKGTKELLYQPIRYVTETVLLVWWNLMLEGLLT